MNELNRCVLGDCRTVLATLPEQAFACCVTSPPYWALRDYGHADQIGLEETPEEYVDKLVEVFALVRRVLRDDGTLWLNLGDTYATGGKGGGGSFQRGRRAWQDAAKRTGFRGPPDGLKAKDLVGIPWRVAFALQADGWYLRSDIIWHKPNPMPESVTDRPTKAHEYVFLLSKSERYYFDGGAVAERAAYPGDNRALRADARKVLDSMSADNGSRARTGRPTGETRNCRSVWQMTSQPYDGAHFATMPPKLAERCILAGCPLGGAVLDPFFGSGTTGQVAECLGRQWLGIELNPDYVALSAKRTAQAGLPFAQESA